MDQIELFRKETNDRISDQAKNQKLKESSGEFLVESIKSQYSYNFNWLGRPIIQYPQDIVAIQELIWNIKPDLIIETGIAHGGSLILSASILELIGKGRVLGIDIDIRKHNKGMIENHSMFNRIDMIEGSSISSDIIEEVSRIVKDKKSVMVFLDSNHTHDHVLEELRLYSPFVTKDSYLVCFDTLVEDLPNDMFQDRPWSVGNNPKTAVYQFLKEDNNFIIDESINNKLMFSAAPDGYLKRIN